MENEFLVRSRRGEAILVKVGPEGFEVKGKRGNCLVLERGLPLVLGRFISNEVGIIDMFFLADGTYEFPDAVETVLPVKE